LKSALKCLHLVKKCIIWPINALIHWKIT